MRDGAAEKWIVGVDIGGTNVSVGLVPFEGGPPIAFARAATRAERGPSAVVGAIATMIRAAVATVGAERVCGCGVGAPGPLDRDRGMVLETPNLGWRDVPLAELVQQGADLPVVLDNDANCFAFGEWWLGAGRRAKRLVGLTLGTGIGGGFVQDGVVYRGASDAATEIGHMCVDLEGRRCACGSRGCVEAYASGSAIAARAAEAVANGADSTLTEFADGDLTRITSEAVCSAAANGDVPAMDIVAETARVLGVAVGNVVHLFNPDVVVIGGGVAEAGARLLVPLRAEAERRAFRSAMAACTIVPSALGDTAGIVGAAGVFKHAVHGQV